MTDLRENSWGKSGVRLVHLRRDGDWFDVCDLEVMTTLVGDTADAYALGSNEKILTTDAQKNAVYALAAERPLLVPEEFALRLASYFVSSQEPVSAASIVIEQRDWRRVDLDGVPAPHSFQGGNVDVRTAQADVSAGKHRVSTGIRGLALLNTTGSEFLGFPHDRYTVGSGTADRILATELDASWSYAVTEADFDAIHTSARTLLIRTFATVYSKSIQFSMNAMAEAVLEVHSEIESITLTFPNLHHYLVDLSQFDIENDKTVFATSHDPHSLIKATFTR
jgi:urate oxidase